YIDLVLLAVGCDAGWFAADFDGVCRLECPQVDDRDGITLAVRDVGVFAISRIEVSDLPLVEIPPAESHQNGKQDCNEKELFQSGSLSVQLLPEIYLGVYLHRDGGPFSCGGFKSLDLINGHAVQVRLDASADTR